jgi:hypothetical protein
MQVEWAKSQARMMRWQEEFEIVQEEMRQVLAWFEWRATWWEQQAEKRNKAHTDILHGVAAYAFKQADIARRMALQCAMDWLPELKKEGINPPWAAKYRCNSMASTFLHPDIALDEVLDERDSVDVVESESEADEDCDDSSDDFEFDD